MSDDKERREALRQKLNEVHQWPSMFMFKFVMPNLEENVEKLHQIFGEEAEFRSRLSKNGNYISFTIRAIMLDADNIFDRYEKAGKIEGIISL